jgi:hypothetical protein
MLNKLIIFIFQYSLIKVLVIIYRINFDMADLCLVQKCRVHGGTHELVFNDNVYSRTLIMAQPELKCVEESVV